MMQSVQVIIERLKTHPEDFFGDLNDGRPQNVKFGELDYESDELTNVELTIRYDWASLEVFQNPFEGVKGAEKKLWSRAGSAGALPTTTGARQVSRS
jgi:hypothetical protein